MYLPNTVASHIPKQGAMYGIILRTIWWTAANL